MDNIKMKEKVGKSQIAELPIQETNPKKKQKLCASQVTSSPSLSKIDLAEAMKKQNDVSMFLAGKVISTLAKTSNLVFSPASINAVLTMAANRPEEKETVRSFILSFLRSSSTDELNAVFGEICSVVLADGSASGGPKIAAVNGVWIDQSLSVDSSWNDLLVNFFKAEFAQVDFSTKAEIVRTEVNAWASRHTNNLIQDLLPRRSVTSQTEWIYGNALYFKGAWEKKFDKCLTKHKPFHLVNGESVSVPFMSSHKNQYVKAYDDFKVLRLGYQKGRDDADRQFSMYFYLPDKRDGLDNLLKKLTSTHGFLDRHIPRYKDRVGKFRIPKFKIEFGFEASNAFDDFELHVSLYQKAFIEIDEVATEAAAATAFGGGGGRPKMIDFVADHPFFFLIREDRTGTVLFVGQIFDPSKSD
ncbi:PREDICTED: serpin-Z2-like [Brassica oleracea var. oleracea]|uniref:Serpin domain-containing protein n=1 Tax=Brassica oleracea var. oleracea TaxID=109376 RepID=A0A0D3E4E8_BRAOL|nr:PREDICTED: serpin-Z2-like [Brassica oleracea var. oleracea]